MSIWDQIDSAITEARGEAFVTDRRRSQGGGCINQAFVLNSDDGSRYFIKLNTPARLAMFEAEAAGLKAMADTGTARVPYPLVTGVGDEHSFIVMEKLSLRGSQSQAEDDLGVQLAAMHRHQSDRFGFICDNTIGSTPQPNTWNEDWIDFWREQRLGFQLDLIRRSGGSRGLIDKGERLMDVFPRLFDAYQPVPSLIHGDLWGGNWAATEDGQAVIFDPAAYYGDREADLAMTELFGGFSRRFYQAYESAWALDAGYPVRKRFYNLYHILNHFNLFGGGYGGQAESMIDLLLSELG